MIGRRLFLFAPIRSLRAEQLVELTAQFLAEGLDHAAAVEALRNGDADISFMGALPFVLAENEIGAVPPPRILDPAEDPHHRPVRVDEILRRARHRLHRGRPCI